jgi:hypothetical protein
MKIIIIDENNLLVDRLSGKLIMDAGNRMVALFDEENLEVARRPCATLKVGRNRIRFVDIGGNDYIARITVEEGEEDGS